MKECPKCHKHYDDSMNFCTDCGVALVNNKEFSRYSAQSNKVEPNNNTTKKTGCFKKIVLTVVVVLVALFGLGSYVNNAATYLRVEPNQLVAPKGGGAIDVGIDYDGYVWTINHAPDWVEIDEKENSFEVFCGNNKTGANLQGTITIQSGKHLAQVAIVQSGFATFIRGSKNQLHFKKKGGVTTVEFESDGCHLQVEAPDYIQTSVIGHKVEITCHANSETYRSGIIRVYEDNQSWIINFSQGGKCDKCNGTGEATCVSCWGQGGTGFGMYYTSCYACGGSGKVECSSCGGSGERE